LTVFKGKTGSIFHAARRGRKGNGRVFEENSRLFLYFVMNVYLAFDTAVRDEPHYRDRKVKNTRDPLIHKSKRNSSGIKRYLKFAFKVAADRLFELFILMAVMTDDSRL